MKDLNERISELKEKNKLTCERNICLKNEYSNIGCEDCVVAKGEPLEELKGKNNETDN